MSGALIRSVVRRSGGWGCGLKLGEMNGRARLSSVTATQEERAIESLGMPRLKTGGKKLRSELEDYFENGWAMTEVLFSSLDDKGFHAPASHGLRHPLIFYYGHPAALAINKLRVAKVLNEPLNGHFEQLLETGVDEMRWDDVIGEEQVWPTTQEVSDYREQARLAVLDVIRNHPALDEDVSEPSSEDVRWALAMICEHDRIHFETSSVLIRELDISMIARRPSEWPADHPSVTSAPIQQPLSFTPVAGGVATLGKPKTDETFGWDNEFGSREIAVDDFETSQLVTNGQYLEFVKGGGYRNPKYWTEEGWGWRTFRNAKWPHFWRVNGPEGLHEYRLRLPFHETDSLPLDLPAEVNAHEARAFAKWYSDDTRLTTEAEYYVMSNKDNDLDEDLSSSSCRNRGVNACLAYGSPSAVVPTSKIVQGNVWQWCEDDFAALPGFEPHYLYDDFSSPCFDGQHTVIKGGSFVSTGDEASSYARFHFRPHFHQHAGFRLTRQMPASRPPELTSYDPAPPLAQGWKPKSYNDILAQTEGKEKYETDAQLAAYLDLHSGRQRGPLGLEHALDFPKRCVDLLPKSGESFLDVGCAVGGACAAARDKGYERVVGFDYSNKFVEVASNRLQDRATVVQGDACDTAFLSGLGTFDSVLAANLLCRLPQPSTFLDALPSLVNKGGHVLLSSPYSFMTEYTPDKEEWLNGDKVKAKMASLGFVLTNETDIPLVIKDHERKYQYIISHGLVFCKF